MQQQPFSEKSWKFSKNLIFFSFLKKKVFGYAGKSKKLIGVTKNSCLKVPDLKNWEKLDLAGFYVNFKPGGMQIDVFWTNPNLLGTARPFQLFRPKNHLIAYKTWYESHKTPILCWKNPTQIREMSFRERWKVIFMLILAHKWSIKLASVHFMVRISDQRINSCCWAWGITLTSFCDCWTSHFWHCFALKDSRQNFGQFVVTNVAFLDWIC